LQHTAISDLGSIRLGENWLGILRLPW